MKISSMPASPSWPLANSWSWLPSFSITNGTLAPAATVISAGSKNILSPSSSAMTRISSPPPTAVREQALKRSAAASSEQASAGSLTASCLPARGRAPRPGPPLPPVNETPRRKDDQHDAGNVEEYPEVDAVAAAVDPPGQCRRGQYASGRAHRGLERRRGAC